VGVEEREDVGEVDPLGHAEQDGGQHEKGQAGSKGDHDEGNGIEYESHSQEALLRDAASQAAQLRRGQRGHKRGAGEDDPDNAGRGIEARVHQDREV
jgi:hypothetical protein